MIYRNTRIICIGNRYCEQDLAGPLVYDHLCGVNLAKNIEIIDGGLGGLDLLRFMTGCKCLVLVDSINGFTQPGSIAILTREEVCATDCRTLDHSSGLIYALKILPEIAEEPVPEILIVGIEGRASGRLIETAAKKCLEIASSDDCTPHMGGEIPAVGVMV